MGVLVDEAGEIRLAHHIVDTVCLGGNPEGGGRGDQALGVDVLILVGQNSRETDDPLLAEVQENFLLPLAVDGGEGADPLVQEIGFAVFSGSGEGRVVQILIFFLLSADSILNEQILYLFCIHNSYPPEKFLSALLPVKYTMIYNPAKDFPDFFPNIPKFLTPAIGMRKKVC